jgi:hypothetical protein
VSSRPGIETEMIGFAGIFCLSNPPCFGKVFIVSELEKPGIVVCFLTDDEWMKLSMKKIKDENETG